ncbi:MAG: hypothetical protein LBD24_08740 [Spirochaetaceae bacterium]|jgi:diaminopimelate epimerase|nr:hypothetical protein [Spirochaetaceae bacterium]
MEEYEIVVSDPAKNITLFVLNQEKMTGEKRLDAARRLMALPDIGAEQVGFVEPPGTPAGLWRLEMAGGEFCGNAARSFGLFVALTQGLSGSVAVPVSISGAKNPVMTVVNTKAGRAAAAIPAPAARAALDFRGQEVGVYQFDGITHLIAPDIPPCRESFFALKALWERGGQSAPALGVLFYDKERDLMTPAVYVFQTDTLVFESSCGSGSAAFGVWRSEGLKDGDARCAVHQPGGVIDVIVVKRNSRLCGLWIGGTVSLSLRPASGGSISFQRSGF